MEDALLRVIIYGVIFGVPALFVLGGAWLSYTAYTFLLGARRTQGKVVSCEKIHSLGSNRPVSYQVTYEYAGSDGSAIQARQFSHGQDSVPIGDVHEILVNPEKSDMVRRPSMAHYTFGPVLLAIGLGVLITMVSVAP